MLLSEVLFLSLRSDGLHKVPSIGCYLDAGLRADMTAQRGAAFLHVSLSAFTFGFENALLMFSYALVFGDTLSVRDFPRAFCVSV